MRNIHDVISKIIPYVPSTDTDELIVSLRKQLKQLQATFSFSAPEAQTRLWEELNVILNRCVRLPLTKTWQVSVVSAYTGWSEAFVEEHLGDVEAISKSAHEGDVFFLLDDDETVPTDCRFRIMHPEDKTRVLYSSPLLTATTIMAEQLRTTYQRPYALIGGAICDRNQSIRGYVSADTDVKELLRYLNRHLPPPTMLNLFAEKE